VAEGLKLPRLYDVRDFNKGAAIQIGYHYLLGYNIIGSTGIYIVVLLGCSVMKKNIVSNTCLNYCDCRVLCAIYNDSTWHLQQLHKRLL
jgi:hypothetical protein